MNFSTSSRAKKSQAALFAVLVAGSLLAATPVSNAAAAVRIGSACSTADAIAVSTTAKTVTCKNKKWTAYKQESFIYSNTSTAFGPKEEFATFAIPKQMKYFDAENLTVTAVPSNGAVAAIAAVASGTADIAGADLGPVMQAIEGSAGSKIIVIGGLVQNWPWSMAVLKGSPIKTPADLKGKKIGIVSPTSGSKPYTIAWLKDNKMTESDVTLVPAAGASSAAAEADLKNGTVDALAWYSAIYASIEFRGTPLTYLPNGPSFKGVRSLSWVANAEKYAANPEVYERYLRAAIKGLVYSNTNIKSAVALGMKEFPQLLLGSTLAEKSPAAEASLKAWLASAAPLTGTPSTWKNLGSLSLAEWKINQAYATLAGNKKISVDFDAFLDTSLIPRANTFDRAPIVAAAKKAK
jgi:NitT/TauT family transport system substrate-binding protein